jgi:hypothetical protein
LFRLAANKFADYIKITFMNLFSKYTYWFCATTLLIIAFFFYPKWEKGGSEATLSWDVAGYYYYLPAIFIYKDIKKVAFHSDLDKKYGYQGDGFYAALPSTNGNLVMKYTSGMALMYAPAFLVAHTLAKPMGYEADGFSRPYQVAISIWSLIIALIGLWFLRKVLLKAGFEDKIVGYTLFTIALATNFTEYSAIANAMTHGYLFTLYAIMLWLTMRFYEGPLKAGSVFRAIGIGVSIGLIVLTRPTELPVIFIPFLWHISNKKDIINRFLFLKKHALKIALTASIIIGLGAIQLIYWKYTSGHFIYNSYGPEDKMEWLNTHIIDGLFSARKGWLVYTPVMLFSLIGFVFLYQKQKQYFWTILPFTLLFIYVSFAHNIWWYGGGLGQRQMVQIYPLLAFPMAAFFQKITQSKVWSYAVLAASLVCLYLNIWLHYQAHRGGHFDAEYTTPAYLRATMGRFDIPLESRKLLDNKYDFTGEKKDIKVLYKTDYENDTSSQNIDNQLVINGKKSFVLNKNIQYSPKIEIPLSLPLSQTGIQKQKWLRASATFKCVQREGNIWGMTQFIIVLKKGNQDVKGFFMRPQRIMNEGETKRIWLDAKVSRYDFDTIIVSIWNGGSDKTVVIDDLELETFDD